MSQGQEVLGGSFGSDTACRETNPCLAVKFQVRKELLTRDCIWKKQAGLMGKREESFVDAGFDFPM